MSPGRRPIVLIALIAVAISALGSTPGSAAPTVDERELLGESFQGRPIHVFHRGDPDEIRVLVVGCIHGDECAGVRIAKRLRTGRPRHFVDLWILPNLNPDGRAAHTRQNARGVDLNRNFPYRWRPGPRGRYYPGRRPASERETRIAMRLIERIEPDVTIWFHQPLALVDASGDDPDGAPIRSPGRPAPRPPPTAVRHGDLLAEAHPSRDRGVRGRAPRRCAPPAQRPPVRQGRVSARRPALAGRFEAPRPDGISLR